LFLGFRSWNLIYIWLRISGVSSNVSTQLIPRSRSHIWRPSVKYHLYGDQIHPISEEELNFLLLLRAWRPNIDVGDRIQKRSYRIADQKRVFTRWMSSHTSFKHVHWALVSRLADSACSWLPYKYLPLSILLTAEQ
jgi:hypothetical protein